MLIWDELRIYSKQAVCEQPEFDDARRSVEAYYWRKGLPRIASGVYFGMVLSWCLEGVVRQRGFARCCNDSLSVCEFLG